MIVQTLAKNQLFKRSFRGDANFYDFVKYHRGTANREPDDGAFNWQSVPSTNENTYHGLVLVAPPLIRQRQRGFPNQANEHNHKKRKAKGAPIDKCFD